MTLDKDIDSALGLALQTHCALEICLSESERLIEERCSTHWSLGT